MQSSIFPAPTGAESATDREIRQTVTGNGPYSGPVADGHQFAGEVDLAVAGLIACPGPYFPGVDCEGTGTPLVEVSVEASADASAGVSLEDSIEARVGQLADAASGEAAAEDLPWIDVFLSSTPVLPMAAVTEEMTSAAVLDPGAGLVEYGDEFPEKLLDAVAEGAGAADVPDEDDEVVNEVPAEVSDDLDRLLDESVGGPDGLGGLLAALDLLQKGYAASDREPMREFGAWSSEDFGDILPLREPGIAPDFDAESGGLHAGQAARAGFTGYVHDYVPGDVQRDVQSEVQGQVQGQFVGGSVSVNSAAAAAEVLEQLAMRVRSGELVLPGYDQNLGDAAALAAALAALLGVKGY